MIMYRKQFSTDINAPANVLDVDVRRFIDAAVSANPATTMVGVDTVSRRITIESVRADGSYLVWSYRGDYI